MIVGRGGRVVVGCGAVVNGQKECLQGDERLECKSDIMKRCPVGAM